MPLSPRERILTAAHDLFYQEGIRATGIDKVISASGVSKVTFYRHFPSKNDLIMAFLDYRHQRWMAWFKDALMRHGTSTEGGLAVLVPSLGEWFNHPLYRGCAFINSAAELGGLMPAVLETALQHKQEMTAVIADLLANTPMRDSIANAAAIAVDGAIIKAQLVSQPNDYSAVLQSLKLILRALEQSLEESKLL